MTKTETLTISIALFIPLFGFCQTADFSFESISGTTCVPATIRFTQNCTGSPVAFIWDFGIDVSDEDTPLITFSTAGTYMVKLTAVYKDKKATVTKNVTINAATIDSIGYSSNNICKPGPIDFKVIGDENLTSFDWDFGDNTPVVSTGSPAITHPFAENGSYKVLLKATSKEGCTTRDSTLVSVVPITILATSSIEEGCVPARVKFKCDVTLPAKSKVSTYAWNFGDGSAVENSTKNSITKIYNAIGNYLPTLKVTTTDACTKTFSFNPLAFGSPPLNLVAYPVKPVVCGQEGADFVAHATNATEFEWRFGDGASNQVSDTIVRHRYKSLGIKYVTVTPLFNGCEGIPDTIKLLVEGIVASFTYANTCADRKTYFFKNTSRGNITEVLWDFGDVGRNIRTKDALQKFPDSGSFRARLEIKDSVSGCETKFEQTIYTANPTFFNADTAVCKGSYTGFGLVNNYTDTAATYTWMFASRQINSSNIPSLEIKADSMGRFDNAVIVYYGSPGESCPDTIISAHSLVVRGPVLSFTAPEHVCFKSPFNVVNNSKPFFPEDSVLTWKWNFGDATKNILAYQPKPYVHKKRGEYSVTLTALDKNGCTDTLSKNYVVNWLPLLHIISPMEKICPGRPDTLIAVYSDSITWSPANLVSCISCDTVVIKPVQSKQFYISATTSFNCIATDSVLITVLKPFAAKTADSSYYICEHGQTQLDVDPANYKIAWSPSAGLSNTNINNPFASPSQSTTYTATVTDSADCFSSNVSINVNVNKAPEADAGPNEEYPHNTSFSFAPVYSGNIVSYQWTPVHLLDCDTCPFPKGIAEETITYTVQVVSDSGCVAKDSVTIAVKPVIPDCETDLFMPGAFTPNNDNLNEYYYPLTIGIKTIAKFAIYNRFGQLLFEAKNFPSNNRSYGWNGRFRGLDQPSSTYVYLLESSCANGHTLKRKGTFLLLR